MSTTQASPASYYFIRKRSSSRSAVSGEHSFGYNKPPSFDETKAISKDRDVVVDSIPDGATVDEFASRPVMAVIRENTNDLVSSLPPFPPPPSSSAARQDLMVRGMSPDGDGLDDVGTLLLERRVPVRVEAKVYFANERTLLAWFHSAVWLFGGAATILMYADYNPYSQFYGIILLPVAIAFTIYAVYRHYIRVKMINIKHPGPYEDLVGPTVLAIILMCAIVAQFAIQMYSMW